MTQKVDEPDLKRVSMVWPAEIKEQVRSLVGSRGLTDFTLDAVREKLQGLAVETPAEPGPRPEPAQAPNPEPAPAEVPTTPPPDAQQEPVPPGHCPGCRDELINGECWTCPTGEA